MSEAYAKMRIRGDVENPSTRIRRDMVGPVSIDRLDLAYAMGYDVNPLGKVCLCAVESGTILNHVAGQDEDVFGPGDTVLFAPPEKPYTGEIRRSRYNIVMFDPVLLAKAAAVDPGHSSGPIRLGGYRAVSEDAARHLAHTIAYLRDEVLPYPELTGSPLVVSASAQLLAASVLAAFPNRTHEPTGPELRSARFETVRRAVAFIDDHADADITLTDIAAAARVSGRTLQYAFREHLGTTPMGYLRRVRLAAAHADLLAADPGHTTVAAVAARWGFFHLGRFAAAYRDAYGYQPSDTLRM
ncbi:helix-turn-helix transcriptional regulator [Planobispora siamensis]|uniref:helix-turn-helix transcriptional regulator n=1 Tax=Planobispora siamensis TaxID=936338 RepID=UPI0035F08102